MMKKIYIAPQTEVIKVKAHQQLLAGRVLNEDADENEYGL